MAPSATPTSTATSPGRGAFNPALFCLRVMANWSLACFPAVDSYSIIEYPSVPDAEDAAKRLEGLQIRYVWLLFPHQYGRPASIQSDRLLCPRSLVAPPLSSSLSPTALAEEEGEATRLPRVTPTRTAGGTTAVTTAATTTVATTGA